MADKLTADADQRREGSMGSHWDDCWRCPDHHECAVARIERLEAELNSVRDMVDDILHDPTWKPVTEAGEPIRGNDRYLLDHPVQNDHMPALRGWFVDSYVAEAAAKAAREGKP